MPDFSYLLEDSLKFADFARLVGERARVASERDGLFRWLLERLIHALFRDDDDLKLNIQGQFKVALGLTLVVACDPDEKNQRLRVEKAFFETLDRTENEKFSNQLHYFLLCELTYLDQFLICPVLRADLADKLKRHFTDAKSPAYVDYKAGWDLSARIQRVQKRVRPELNKSRETQVILIGSVKGGVGKTLISLSLAHHLIKTDENARVALLDLDASGPTVQYNLDVPAVSLGLNTKSTKSRPFDDMRWTYPTFGDLITDRIYDEYPRSISPQMLLARVKENDPDLKSVEDRLRVILLPDSPIVAGVTVSSRWFNSLESADVLVAIDKIMNSAVDSEVPSPFNFNYLIVDLGPGLFGTNGSLFTWLTRRYATSLILVTSPRTFDIATSLYESVWLSAPNYLGWDRPVLQLLNMSPWSADEIYKKLEERTNSALETVLHADFDIRSKKAKRTGPSDSEAESTDYIMFWRLRAYLYIVAIESASGENTAKPETFDSRYNVRSLRYDNELRQLLHLFDLKPLDMSKVMETEWYKKDFKKDIKSWLKVPRTFGAEK